MQGQEDTESDVVLIEKNTLQSFCREERREGEREGGRKGGREDRKMASPRCWVASALTGASDDLGACTHDAYHYLSYVSQTETPQTHLQGEGGGGGEKGRGGEGG